MTPQEKLRERAAFVLAKLKLITGPVDHYDENISIIEQALIETRNEALEEAIQVPWGPDHAKNIRSLKTGEGK